MYENFLRVMDKAARESGLTYPDHMPANWVLSLGHLRAASALLEADGWSPISTAPLDRRILGCGALEAGGYYVEAIRWLAGRFGDEGGCWPIKFMHGFGDPTHWREMPPLPLAYRAEGGAIPDLLAPLEARIRELEAALTAADKAAEAGLCQFSPLSKQEFLRDIRRSASSVGVQGGLTPAG